MLQLVAQFADEWNRDFGPEGAFADLPAWRDRVDQACGAVGRDPGTLRRSAAVTILPRGYENPMPTPPVTGSPADIAREPGAYATAGYAEVDCWLMVAGRPGLDQFAEVLAILDGETQPVA